MRKQKSLPKLTLRIIYEDGRIESICDAAPYIRQRFASLVYSFCNTYIEPVTIQIIDNRNKLWKEFKQNY